MSFLTTPFRISLIVVIFSSCGMGERPTLSESSDLSQVHKARKVLEVLTDAYRAKDEHAFFSHVSDESFFNLLDFKIRLREEFNQSSQHTLRFWGDEALVEADKVIVQIHWQKRALLEKSSQVTITKGKADFLFESNQEARLLDIKGDNPFLSDRQKS